MPSNNRRALLVAVSGSAAVPISGLALIPHKAQSSPLPINLVPAVVTEDRVEKAGVVVHSRRRRRERRRHTWR
jgi:hypothetical protein